MIRQAVFQLAALQEFGAGNGDCSESILVKDRICIGRRICLGRFEAIWISAQPAIQCVETETIRQTERLWPRTSAKGKVPTSTVPCFIS